MATTKLDVNITSHTNLNVNLNNGTTLNVGLKTPVGSGGTNNYNYLNNKPQINGIELSGNQSLSDLHIVSENTEEGWSGLPFYVPKNGEICLYSDTGRLKIGDGSVPIVDLPFANQQDIEEINARLQEHIEDTTIHVTSEDKQRWNNPAEYSPSDESLIIYPY